MLSYTDEATYRDAGQGGFEIRTFIAVAAAAAGRGTLHHYHAIPTFAVGCTIAEMSLGPCPT
jgi:2,3-dihydroxyphenylpropionate 1,2-dioxygenase